jgi:uncharacterized protein
MIDQGELFDIPNPCRGICTVNNKGYCKGCLRSRQERFHWNVFSNFQKQLIVNLCERRRLKILASRQTHNGQIEDNPASYQDSPQTDMFASALAATRSLPEPPALPDDIPAEKRHSPGPDSQAGLFDD